MSVYDLDGNELFNVYDVDGVTLNQAYDIDGNPLLDLEPDKLTIMSYNVQWWQNFNSQQTMQNEIIAKYKPNIIGFQEFSKTDSIPSVGIMALGNYSTIRLSNHFNFNAMASKFALEDVTIADYETQDSYDLNSNETRSYMKAYFTFNGKRICWINTHLCYYTNSAQYAQAAELLAMAEEEDYVVITGDFNSYGLNAESSDYIGIFKPFVDAGYNLANSTTEKGFTKTWTTSTTATSTADMTYPCDNIITSSNIDINSVVFDDTKFSYLNGQSIDHIPLVAEVTIS